MIKHIILGVWICVVALGAAFGAMSWQVEQIKQEATAKPEVEKLVTEQIKTRMINVPLVQKGNVIGYVLAQFTFTVDTALMKTSTIKPDLILIDEAFRLIYSGEAIDFRSLDKPNVAALAAKIKENVNKRLEAPLVQDVFVQELNFIQKEQYRGTTGQKN